MRPIAVAAWLNVLAQLYRQLRVSVEGLDALSVEAPARLQLRRRGEVADHRPRADPLRIADPQLPADPLRTRAARGTPNARAGSPTQTPGVGRHNSSPASYGS